MWGQLRKNEEWGFAKHSSTKFRSHPNDFNNKMVMINMLQLFTFQLSESCARTGLPHLLPTLDSKNPALVRGNLCLFYVGFLTFQVVVSTRIGSPNYIYANSHHCSLGIPTKGVVTKTHGPQVTCTRSSNFMEPKTSKVTTALSPKRSTRTPASTVRQFGFFQVPWNYGTMCSRDIGIISYTLT